MQPLKKLEVAAASWPQISVFPHRFGGREFRFANAEVGHVHDGGIVDIPFPRSVRDALLAEGLAEGASVGSQFRVGYISRSNRQGFATRRLAYAIVLPPLRSQDCCGSPRVVCGGESRTTINPSVQVSSRTIHDSSQAAAFGSLDRARCLFPSSPCPPSGITKVVSSRLYYPANK
jgi:luciferase-like monooxygenase